MATLSSAWPHFVQGAQKILPVAFCELSAQATRGQSARPRVELDVELRTLADQLQQACICCSTFWMCCAMCACEATLGTCQPPKQKQTLVWLDMQYVHLYSRRVANRTLSAEHIILAHFITRPWQVSRRIGRIEPCVTAIELKLEEQKSSSPRVPFILRRSHYLCSIVMVRKLPLCIHVGFFRLFQANCFAPKSSKSKIMCQVRS